MTVLHQSPAYELRVDIQPTRLGHHLRFSSFVPTARRPEEQERFSATLSREGLLELKRALDRALTTI